MVHENVMNELNSIMMSIPKDISPLEKIRYVYIKVGEVFCYDYYYSYKIGMFFFLFFICVFVCLFINRIM